MEKAKLTREQVSALNAALEHKTPAEVVEFHADENTYWDYRREPLLHLDMDTLCRALYVGYEIIEEDQTVVVTAEKLDDIRSAIEKCTRDADFIWNQGAEYVLKKLGIKL